MKRFPQPEFLQQNIKLTNVIIKVVLQKQYREGFQSFIRKAQDFSVKGNYPRARLLICLKVIDGVVFHPRFRSPMTDVFRSDFKKDSFISLIGK
jgi:hypothetical protein